MFEGTYRIAECTVKISSLYPQVHALCKDYRHDGEAELTISITREHIDFERQKSAAEDEREGVPVREFPDSYLETLAVYRQLAGAMLARDTLLFHGSVIAVDGAAYLFTAKSGTGKSTHTRLWRQMLGDRAVMVNDDKPLLRVTDQGVIACGTPWNGKHNLGENIQVPLKAICILERGEENRIRQVQVIEALPMILQQSYRMGDKESRRKYLELLDKLMTQLRFYRLQCNMDPEAARVAYEAMKE